MLMLNTVPPTHGQHVYSACHLIPQAGQAGKIQVRLRSQRHQGQVLAGGLPEWLWRSPQLSTWRSVLFPRAV